VSSGAFAGGWADSHSSRVIGRPGQALHAHGDAGELGVASGRALHDQARGRRHQDRVNDLAQRLAGLNPGGPAVQPRGGRVPREAGLLHIGRGKAATEGMHVKVGIRDPVAAVAVQELEQQECVVLGGELHRRGHGDALALAPVPEAGQGLPVVRVNLEGEAVALGGARDDAADRGLPVAASLGREADRQHGGAPGGHEHVGVSQDVPLSLPEDAVAPVVPVGRGALVERAGPAPDRPPLLTQGRVPVGLNHTPEEVALGRRVGRPEVEAVEELAGLCGRAHGRTAGPALGRLAPLGRRREPLPRPEVQRNRPVALLHIELDRDVRSPLGIVADAHVAPGAPQAGVGAEGPGCVDGVEGVDGPAQQRRGAGQGWGDQVDLVELLLGDVADRRVCGHQEDRQRPGQLELPHGSVWVDGLYAAVCMEVQPRVPGVPAGQRQVCTCVVRTGGRVQHRATGKRVDGGFLVVQPTVPHALGVLHRAPDPVGKVVVVLQQADFPALPRQLLVEDGGQGQQL
jgi:hypothetical protein